MSYRIYTYADPYRINQTDFWQEIKSYPQLCASRTLTRGCRANNLNALWAIELLYIPGNSQDRFGNILEHNLRPIYEAAMLQGYGVWE